MSSFATWTPKGGVGKTTFSVQLATMLGYTYVTNDEYCSAEDKFEKGKGFLVPEGHHEIPFADKVVFDLGGFKDERIKPLLEKVEKVIVPTLDSEYDIKALTSILKALSTMNSSVVILINNIEPDYTNKENKYHEADRAENDIMKIVEDNKLTFKSLQFVRIRKSKGYKTLIKENASVFDYCKDNGVLLNRFRNIIEDMTVFRNTVLN
ncbi:hypothetical protein ALC152_04930 [Arcobacter sp. 15-2]|uniref:hypothetical protein n=1 Tax=Arcobacter sp. 15-2 TaxID=3374109 RepID=UPI00399CE5B9